MEIVFSRHAKRRLKLYDINPDDFKDSILEKSSDIMPNQKTIKILDSKDILTKYRYPLKLIYIRKTDAIIIITVYPFKKGAKK